MGASDVETDTAGFVVQPGPRRSRSRHGRRRAVRRRRPGWLLGALLVGGVVGATATQAVPDAVAQPASVLAAQQALRADDSDDGAEAMPQASITVAEAQARLATVAASRAQRESAAAAAPRPECVLPVKGATLTSTFAMRWGVMHWGIDLAAPMDTPEYAARDGVVLRAGAASGFGLAIWILHPNGDVTVYGHMDKILVRPGQVVQAGDEIALMGARGEATGPHLHFEVHKDSEYGNKIDPIPWLAACGVQV